MSGSTKFNFESFTVCECILTIIVCRQTGGKKHPLNEAEWLIKLMLRHSTVINNTYLSTEWGG